MIKRFILIISATSQTSYIVLYKKKRDNFIFVFEPYNLIIHIFKYASFLITRDEADQWVVSLFLDH